MVGDFLLGNYKVVSEQLGLTIDGGVGQDHLLIHGQINGTQVELWFGAHATKTRARLQHHAPSKLALTTRSWFARLFGIGRGIGDPAFDRRFRVVEGDPTLAAKLLSNDARDVLLEIARLRLHPTVEHDRVQLRMFSNGGGDDRQKILRLLNETARLGSVIDASFASQ